MAAAVGTVTNYNNSVRAICLMFNLTATNAAPSGATQAGAVPNYPTNAIVNSDTGACYDGRPARESMLSLYSTAGSGTITGTFVLWGFLPAGSAGANGPNAGAGIWVPVIKVNGGSSISQTAPLTFAERELNLGLYSQLYLQCTAITGTSAAYEAWLSTAYKGGQD